MVILNAKRDNEEMVRKTFLNLVKCILFGTSFLENDLVKYIKNLKV